MRTPRGPRPAASPGPPLSQASSCGGSEHSVSYDDSAAEPVMSRELLGVSFVGF